MNEAPRQRSLEMQAVKHEIREEHGDAADVNHPRRKKTKSVRMSRRRIQVAIPATRR